jgi:hypothetical protein
LVCLGQEKSGNPVPNQVFSSFCVKMFELHFVLRLTRENLEVFKGSFRSKGGKMLLCRQKPHESRKKQFGAKQRRHIWLNFEPRGSNFVPLSRVTRLGELSPQLNST